MICWSGERFLSLSTILKSMLDDAIEERLREWARWLALREAAGHIAFTSAYEGQIRTDRYAESSTPTSFGQASDTDNAVKRLPEDLQTTLWAEYVRRGPKNEFLGNLTQKQVANRHMGISQRTYERWLEEAKKRLKEELRLLRDAANAPYLTVGGMAQ